MIIATMGSIEHYGTWWDAADPDRTWPGTACFDPNRGTVLTCHVETEKPQPFGQLREYELIHGVSVSGVPITLVSCFDQSRRGSFFVNLSQVKIFANEMISGAHCASTDPPLVHATVRFDGITSWWERPAFESDTANYATGYRPNKSVLLYDGPFRVSLEPNAVGSFSAQRVRMKEEITFQIEAPEARPLSEFRRMVKACNDLLTIAYSTLCNIAEFSIIPPKLPDDRPRIGRLHAVPFLKKRDGRKQRSHEMLFRFNDFAGRAPTVFANWFEKVELLEDARTLYLVGLYGGGYIEHRVLALTQAAEAYHRRFFDDRYMEQERFETDVLPPIVAAVPAAIDASHRAAIMARLRFANEVSLRRRLRDLFAANSEILVILIDEADSFIAPIVEMRNQFTHLPVPISDSRGKASGYRDRALLFTWILRLLLESCFLTQMGFQRSEIVEFVRRSESYRQMSRRFAGAKA